MNRTTTTEQEVWRALEDVYDPEIPNLSLVDLGMVSAVSVAEGSDVPVTMGQTLRGEAPAGREGAASLAGPESGRQSAGESARGEGAEVSIRLLPTFVGCPALEFIKARVVNRVQTVDGVGTVRCSFVMDETWTTERITDQGRVRLEAFGIAPPPTSFHGKQIPTCPYCKADEADVVSLFGPTACRAIFYCKHCQQPFEGMKYI